jgi:hypothetical protein
LITDYESESLGPICGLIRQELLHVATSILPRAVELRNSYDTISNMGGFLESDFTVLTNTIIHDLSDYVGPDVKLVVSRPVDNTAASVTQLTCLQLLTPDALTRSGNFGGHIQRGVSRILRARAYLDLLALSKSSPLYYMWLNFGNESWCFGSLFPFA